MSTRLGKYAALATTFVVVCAFLSPIITRLGGPLGMHPDGFLDTLGLAAFTYLLGSTAVVNGWKEPIAAAHARMDAAGIPSASSQTTRNG